MIDRKNFHGTSIFHTYKEMMELEMQLIHKYIENVSDGFNEKGTSLESVFSQENSEGFGHFEDEYFENALNFPIFLYASSFMALQTILEKNLSLIATRSEESRFGFTPISRTVDIREDTWVDIEQYLLRISKRLDLSQMEPQPFKRINNDARPIRNLFVHQGGNIKNSNTGDETRPENLTKRQKAEIKKRNRIKEIVYAAQGKLTFDQYEAEVIISKEYVLSYLEDIKKILAYLFTEAFNKHTLHLRS